MKLPRHVSITIFLLGAAGLALFLFLIIRHGIGDILAIALQAGWGLLLVFAAHALSRLFDSLSWRALIPREYRPAFWRLLLIHWIGDSVSAMLPVAQVGGEVIRVRMLASTLAPNKQPIPLSISTSSVLVGMTISLATQIVFLLSRHSAGMPMIFTPS